MRLVWGLLWVGLSMGCRGSGEADLVEPEPTDVSTSTSTQTSSTVAGSTHGGYAYGLTIEKISGYQAMETVLMENGQAPDDEQVPWLDGRDVRLRVFIDPADEASEEVLGMLTVSGSKGELVLERTKTVRQTSTDEKMGSTINFDIPADHVELGMALDLVVYDADLEGGGGEAEAMTWSSSEDVVVEWSDTLELTLIPIEYNADGSGRLPDTSESQLQLYRDVMFAMYPVTDVVITVTEPWPWSRELEASGDGWESLLSDVSDARSRADVPDKTYFYAIFEPDDSLYSFCSWGCTLGLSYVAERANDTWARASIGIGFTGMDAVETMAHEIGHAHGRDHSPCGVSPSDRNYPHEGGVINVWGYNQVTEELFGPDDKDIMGYCNPVWISDYTYVNLFSRVRALSPLGFVQGGSTLWPSYVVDGEGETRWVAGDVWVRGLPGGLEAPVLLLDVHGESMGVETGFVTAYGHLPGGRVVVPPHEGTHSVRVLDTRDIDRPVQLAYPFE
jgi:hypothetical protein